MIHSTIHKRRTLTGSVVVAALAVVVVARLTKSLVWSAIAGVVVYALLMAL